MKIKQSHRILNAWLNRNVLRLKVKAHHLYSATNRKLQLQRRFASQTERACSL